jgi:hypothetical protein
MARNRILDGVGGGKFKPDDPVTREQFAKVMVLALQIKMLSSYAPSFSDVSKGSWSFRYVEAAKPYLTGWRVGPGQLDQFRPEEVAVREDMAVALVKALGLHSSAEAPDLSVLEAFGDQSTISTNLRRHVALAVSNGIMNGVLLADGTKAFEAQGVLTRAQAAVLVFNALVKAGEKVAYDDDPTKVTYDDPATAPGGAGQYAKANASASVTGDKLVVTWNRIADSRLNGYKVVLSAGTATPVYPEDGYYTWITDASTNSVTIRAGKPYNGGDIGGVLKAGVRYYLSITAVYDGHSVKVPGDAIEIVLPASVPPEAPLPVTTIKQANKDGDVLLSWTKIADSRLTGYKVVLSRGNTLPVYPDDGYLVWITDPCQTSVVLRAGDRYQGSNDFGGRLEAGGSYYARVTALFKDGKTNSNVIRVTLP